MKPKTYHEFVDSVLKPGTFPEKLTHAALGIGGESGEVVDLIKKFVIYGKPLNEEKLAEELGDLLFYMQVVLNQIGLRISDIQWMNQEKLSARFHEGKYSPEQAIARKDKA